MDRTDNVIDFSRYRSRRQARRLGETMWAVYAWRAGYAVSQPPARHDERSRRA
ncbi:TPA: hypothetical protein ACGJWA_002233 [Pseudomonas aeruginosa]|uniref:hypothetical protein n=1 Tax=Pseudomonas aeruginosa TaxID=287 RepID=UPI00053DD0E1|nr:hypothetical protein [Pseudomonas aeruginosa]HBO1242019.1 hypothetical protein [Pseudomonas aeruginosa]HBO1878882.1 hypothetical protein [Pseudomonas aeruginosa]HBO2084881.1 hypothetical protein [Pseudomonas aeruginosa]